jgi:hypothetical protein
VNSKQKTEIRKIIETAKNRGLAYLATAHHTSPLGAQPGIPNRYASDQRDPPRGAIIFHLPIGEGARWRLLVARRASRCAPLLSNIYKSLCRRRRTLVCFTFVLASSHPNSLETLAPANFLAVDGGLLKLRCAASKPRLDA